MHVDWQQITALAIVTVAMLAVGRRIYGQIAAFRTKPGKSSSGCDGCPSSGGTKAVSSAPPLVQIQMRPPVHLRRPPTE